MKTAVVFIHGFTGGAETWQNNEGTKFSDLLKKDPEVNGDFSFFEFTYYTKLTDFFTSAKFQKVVNAIPILNWIPGVSGKVKVNRPIAQLSEQLATYLNLELGGFDEVILIAHSMGGLIAKDHIINYEPGHGPKPAGFVSMAVPHKGSFGGLILGPVNINARELVPLSEYSDALNNKWTEQKQNLPPTLYMIAQHDECVVKESAVPFTVLKSDKAIVDHDHTSICKPASNTDMSYLAVKKFLKDFFYEKSMHALASDAFLMSMPDYDKEIFVLKMIVCDIGKMGIDDAKDCFFNAEIISKAANRKDAEELRGLQSKVLSLYKQKYNACNGEKLSSNAIFAAVHAEITAQDSGVLKSTASYLNFLHKKGLLHQLANNMRQDVIWSDSTDFTAIKEKMS
jgi:esterase/lipase